MKQFNYWYLLWFIIFVIPLYQIYKYGFTGYIKNKRQKQAQNFKNAAVIMNNF
jgi:lipoprotein signal peptidase